MGTEDASEAQKKAPKRSTASDDEDLRLLGYVKQQANDAATIIKPPSTRPPRPRKLYSNTVRPMNTLSMSSTLPTPTQYTRQTNVPSRHHKLAVEVSRGLNVRGNQVQEAEENAKAYQSTKRQKIVHLNSASSISSESIDDLPAESVRFGGQAGKSPVISQRSQVPPISTETQPRVGMASEFGGVELMMDSSQRKAKRKKQSRLRNAASPLMNLTTKTNPVEVDSDEGQMTAKRGFHDGHTNETARSQDPKLPRHNGKDYERKSQNKTRSPYFAPKSDHSRPAVDEEGNLSTKFVASNGSRRGFQDRLSSDELDGPPTIGLHADVVPVSPGVRRQAVSPQKPTLISKSNGTASEEQPVEPSNIKPTKFTSQPPSKGKANHREDFDKDYLSGETPSWAVPLAAVNIPGQELHANPDMNLVYDKSDRVYFVMEEGAPLRVAGSRLEIYPRSLQKIWWASPGKQVRFESSKRGIADHILDLELKSEKDLSGLMKRLQIESVQVKIIGENSDKMQKRFEVRRKQQLRPVKSPIPRFEDMDEDVQLAAINQQRRHQALAGQQTSNTSRRQTSPPISLAHKMTSNRKSAEPQQKNPSRTRQNDRDQTSIDSGDENIGRPKLLSKYQPAHNDHLNLRRSTRSSGLLIKYFGPSPEHQEAKAKKYSVEYGLGERWSKPLSYPKGGKKQATVEFDDLVRLDEDEFLNDNLVGFYMRYLEQEFSEKSPELARTVYFFNSFFYNRLNTTQRGQKGINYEGVQRWTRGVDIFAYDYAIVPINESAHWYVAIICNLPALGQIGDPSEEASSPVSAANVERTPVLDTSVDEEKIPEPQEKQTRDSFAELSLGGMRHNRQPSEDSLIGQAETIDVESANDVDEDHEMLDVPNAANQRVTPPKPIDIEKPEILEDTDDGPRPGSSAKKQKRKSLLPTITKRDPASPVIITFDSFGHPHSNVIRVLKQYLYEEGNAKKSIEFDVGKIKGITAKNIPQQNNFSDCGLYMLGYVEKFLEDHPKDFIGKIIKREYDDQKDWPKMVPSNMRKSLREQLQRLHEEDEAERIALKTAKRASGSRDAEKKSSINDKDPHHTGEAASSIQPKDNEDVVSGSERRKTDKGPPIDVQQIRNARYHPPSETQDEQGETSLEDAKQSNATEAINEPTQDDSLIVVGSHDHTDSTIKLSSPVPSSQLPQHPKSNAGTRSASPVLPTVIEDSQPLQPQMRDVKPPAPSKPLEEDPEQNKNPESFALSPSPSHLNPGEEEKIPMIFDKEEKEEARPQSMVYTNWRPALEDRSGTSHASPSPTRLGKRGVAQKVQTPNKRQQQQQGKKMKKEDAIVLDD